MGLFFFANGLRKNLLNVLNVIGITNSYKGVLRSLNPPQITCDTSRCIMLLTDNLEFTQGVRHQRHWNQLLVKHTASRLGTWNIHIKFLIFLISVLQLDISSSPQCNVLPPIEEIVTQILGDDNFLLNLQKSYWTEEKIISSCPTQVYLKKNIFTIKLINKLIYFFLEKFSFFKGFYFFTITITRYIHQSR